MVAYRLVFLASAVAALPLNINLGAYSPALVVGDGEISFGGNQDVSGLMSVLQGAAVSAANGAATNGAAQGAGEAAGAARPAAAAAATTPQAVTPNTQAAQPAAVPAVDASANAGTVDPTLTQQAQQIAALQGMGKSVLPRAEPVDDAEDEDEDDVSSTASKRDLASFDRALKFAEAALVKGPKVQLGTGEAGVGIIVDNNPTSAARAGTGAAEKKRKRDVGIIPSTKVKVTTMYVRSGIPASLQSGGKMTVRDLAAAISEPHIQTIEIAPTKREASASPGGLDSVNLNVNGDQGVTMTFVETVEEGEDDD